MPEEIHAPRPESSYERHHLTFHPKIWQWLTTVAEENYGGNVSAAVTAFVLYNEGVKRAKALKGETHIHTVTRGNVTDPMTLEAMIREIESDEPGFSGRTWLGLEKGTES